MENKIEEEIIKETKKDNILIIVGIIMLIIIAVVIVFYTLNKNNDKKPNGNTVTISDDILTTLDDTQIDKNTEKKGNTVYIYAKGYADMAPIAFTYECKSENCNIYTTEKGIILYDENNVLYRELTQYEYEQIYNQEVSPVGEKLDIQGFKYISPKISLTTSEIKEIKNGIYIYEVDGNKYIDYEKEKFMDINQFNDVDIEFIEDKIIIYSYIYDYKKNSVINVCPDTNIESIKKEGSFYILGYSYHDTTFSIFNESLDKHIASQTSYYINDDKLYYIEDEKLHIVDKNVQKIEFDNTNMTSLVISTNKLVYLDTEGKINIRNIETNEEFFKSDIILPRYSKYLSRDFRAFYNKDNKYYIIYRDYSVIDNEDWEKYVREIKDFNSGSIDSEIEKMKQCKNNIEECREDAYYITGYILEISEKGELISKNYYFGD